ncbi:MAG TPA: hypothetical protein VKP11_07365 [Frankiaceae bacterium]|nr:hypothetical protein [Frankiaceae bacterium]
MAALQALALLDGAPAASPDGRGAPAATGATLELALPDWRLRRRSWPVHPACRCAAATAERETAVG